MSVMPLEKRGIATSRLVMGNMPFGGAWNHDPVTKEQVLEAEKAVDAALSIGITMYDHADIYTRGKAEQIFGQILKARPGLREQIVLQSKVGIVLSEGKVPGHFNFSKEHILKNVDGTLERLGIDYLDVLLLHRPDPLMEPEEVAEALAKLKAAGKVRYFGVSNMNVAQIEFLQQAIPDQLCVNQLEMGLGRVDFVNQDVFVNQTKGVQTHFSPGLMEYSRMKNIQLQAWGPLAQGRFSGRALDNEPEHIQQTAELVKQMAQDKDTTAEAIVLGWLMKHPAKIQPVIGSTKAERILACKDAERQAELMTREEWYTLYMSARGEKLS
ncbi:aldo/keto reductase [Xylanibacillus composti]|uniref:Oxidoreductase n=1 Tax=Xylanibacillus composti TaxID=1572762 RepID=A0A8J4M1I1_9BACL|nr:aldo/keto reductase [Xylanibacillus composti]MDT9726225.1 aldo/keto reductase [Xylanibacillus composti]GIQ68075.1 oxidoreductase [Xylanibacillus composti]